MRRLILTFIPSTSPSSLPKVVSTSTVGTSCSCLPPARAEARPSLPTIGATFACDCMPVHPMNTDFEAPLARCLASLLDGAAARYVSSTTTFCAIVFELSKTATKEEGRLSKQFLRLGEKTKSTCAEDVFREVIRKARTFQHRGGPVHEIYIIMSGEYTVRRSLEVLREALFEDARFIKHNYEAEARAERTAVLL